jgi:DNA-binding response OmpR family regulator
MDAALPTILLIEDEPDLREALGEYLDACGFAVTAVGCAAEALVAARTAPPALVVCDLSLPDDRGDRFLESFHELFPRSLLYVHSGDSTFSPSAALRACGLTQDHVFAKPADLGEMVARLRSDLNRAGS